MDSNKRGFWVGLFIAAILVVGGGVFYIQSKIRELEEQLNGIKKGAVSPLPSIQVRILAKQYTWHFQYPGADGVFGEVDPSTATEDNPMGLDLSDSAGDDDVISKELVLPCSTDIELLLVSGDIIHSLGELEGDLEIDAIPGMENPAILESPSKPREGRFRCVQLCGAGHENHHAPYRFATMTEFDLWLEEQRLRTR